jgi:hypothetical protein
MSRLRSPPCVNMLGLIGLVLMLGKIEPIQWRAGDRSDRCNIVPLLQGNRESSMTKTLLIEFTLQGIRALMTGSASGICATPVCRRSVKPMTWPSPSL